MSSQEPAIVYAGSFIDAAFVRSLLEAQGIRAFLLDEFMGTAEPWVTGPGGVGAVKVAVAGPDSKRAKPIVEKYLRERV